MSDLELVPTSDLLVELGRRFDAVLAVGWLDKTQEHDSTTVYWRGGVAPCLGLAEYARIKIADNID